MEIMTILENLNRCHSPSGEEKTVCEVIREYAAPFADDYRTDALGNLIIHHQGGGKKVMVSAHMDTVGLIITYIDENGFLSFSKVGGVEAKDIMHHVVRFRSGLQGIVAQKESSVSKDKIGFQDLYIDIGAKDRKDAERVVKPGDTAIFIGRLFTIGDMIVSPYLDNRVSCAVLLDVLSKLENRNNDVYFVFSAQEEVGLRGAKTASYQIRPDYAVVVDVTECDDMPGSAHTATARLRGGAGIKIMDRSFFSHPDTVSRLSALAKKKKIAVQKDLMTDGGTDGGAIHTAGEGVITGGISIPCRYVHTAEEIVCNSDVKAAAALLQAYLESDL